MQKISCIGLIKVAFQDACNIRPRTYTIAPLTLTSFKVVPGKATKAKAVSH